MGPQPILELEACVEELANADLSTVRIQLLAPAPSCGRTRDGGEAGAKGPGPRGPGPGPEGEAEGGDSAAPAATVTALRAGLTYLPGTSAPRQGAGSGPIGGLGGGRSTLGAPAVGGIIHLLDIEAPLKAGVPIELPPPTIPSPATSPVIPDTPLPTGCGHGPPPAGSKDSKGGITTSDLLTSKGDTGGGGRKDEDVGGDDDDMMAMEVAAVEEGAEARRGTGTGIDDVEPMRTGDSDDTDDANNANAGGGGSGDGTSSPIESPKIVAALSVERLITSPPPGPTETGPVARTPSKAAGTAPSPAPPTIVPIATAPAAPSAVATAAATTAASVFPAGAIEAPPPPSPLVSIRGGVAVFRAKGGDWTAHVAMIKQAPRLAFLAQAAGAAAVVFLWPRRPTRHPPVQPLLPSPNYDTPVVGP
jgi:hypothetical protein